MFADWDVEKDGWFPFANVGDQILFVNPDNMDESYWTKNENYEDEQFESD